MRRYLILLFFSPAVFAASAQTPSGLRGRVLDAVTREPVVAASIREAGSTNILTPDTLGYFMASGGGKLNIRCIGYQPWSGFLTPENQIILLDPSDETLGTVVVSATLKEVSKDASPIPVEIYTPRFFRKNVTPNLFEALTVVNGVRPQLNCNICNTGDIHINGMEGPYTMVTIDGMPIVSGLSTVYGLSGIPNSMVERIEVVKGPAGTLFGSEAVGGMINIITKNALTAPRFTAEVFGTSIGEYNLDAAVATQAGKARTLLGINYFNFNNRLDINGDNFTDLTLQDRISVFNKWSFTRKKGRLASIAARYVYENRWGGELQWTPEWRGTDSIYGESIYTRRAEILGKYQLPVEARRMFLDVSWNLHDQDSYYGTTPYTGRQQVFFGQLYSDLPAGKKHDAILGLALRYTGYDDNTPATATPDGSHNAPAHSWLPGVFVQDEVNLNARHRLLLGLRYDHHSAHGYILTPRLSWKWSKDEQHILRLTTGSGYRVANIFTEDHAALTGAREVVIAENLLPERSWNGNLNYVRKFFPDKIGFIGLDASLFFTRFANQILPDYASDPDKIIYKNLDGHAVSSGLTFNLDFNFLNGLKIMTGATAMRVYRVEQGVRSPQLFAPPVSGTWTISYPLRRWKMNIDYTGTCTSPMHLPVLPNDPRPAQSPWYSIHNLQVTKNLRGGFELYAGIKNLLGFYPREEVILRAFDPFDKQIEINNPYGHSFDPSYNYAPIQGRRLLLGCRWTMR
jgi:outer membrane receptor for ferrienterochelin and colicins